MTTSSSSLAYALGPPPAPIYPRPAPPPQLSPPQRVYHPQESAAFLDDFLQQKTREMNQPDRTINHAHSTQPRPVPPQHRPLTPPATVLPPPQESPDPLSLLEPAPSISRTNSTATIPSFTPRKRKMIAQLDSPTVKRIHSLKSLHPSAQKSPQRSPRPAHPPVTPSRASFSSSLSSLPPSSQPRPPSQPPTQTPVLGRSSTPTPKRIVNLAYVAVPPRPWLTPSSSQTSPSATASPTRHGRLRESGTPDLGGYGSEEDAEGDFDYDLGFAEEHPHTSPTRSRAAAAAAAQLPSSARRTGDRDDRAPLEKLTSLIEDIFEAEDTLPPDLDADSAALDLPHEFFSPLTTDFARPLLAPALVRKLTKYVNNVARPTKRLRRATLSSKPNSRTGAGAGGAPGAGATPRVAAGQRMAEVETQVLSRLLKMLERNVRAGEDVDPFIYAGSAGAGAPLSGVSMSPRKKKAGAAAGGKGKTRSKTPGGEHEEVVDEGRGRDSDEGKGGAAERELTEADFENLTRLLEVARDSILAADCCIALLGSDRLAKQVRLLSIRASALLTPPVHSCTRKSSSPRVSAPSRTSSPSSSTPSSRPPRTPSPPPRPRSAPCSSTSSATPRPPAAPPAPPPPRPPPTRTRTGGSSARRSRRSPPSCPASTRS